MNDVVEFGRWTLAVVLFGFEAVLVALWMDGLVGALRKQGTGSYVPFLGACSGCAALLVIPVEGSSAWWWVPFVADPGAALSLAVAAAACLRRAWRGRAVRSRRHRLKISPRT